MIASKHYRIEHSAWTVCERNMPGKRTSHHTTQKHIALVDDTNITTFTWHMVLYISCMTIALFHILLHIPCNSPFDNRMLLSSSSHLYMVHDQQP